MNPDRHFVLSRVVATAICATATLSAQSPTAPVASPADLLAGLRVPLHAETDPDGTSHGVWAGGADWKASFHDGVRFLARPADVAGAAVPFGWETVVEPGADGVRPRPALRIVDAFHAEYDHGAVVERYEVRIDGLEQSFVVARPVVGDLTIRGRVTGGLTAAERGPAHAPLEFRSADGNVAMGYGAAFVVDAAGRSAPITTAHADGIVTLRVPAAWLATAVYPVTVDPLLGNVLVHTEGSVVRRVVTFREDRNASHNVGVLFEREFAAGSHDLFFMLASDAGLDATLITSRLSAGFPFDADLAYVAGTNRWVVTYSAFDHGQFVERNVVFQHTGGSTTFNGATAWAPRNGSARQRRAVVGGSTRGSESTALIVWEAEPANTSGNTGTTSIWGALLDTLDGRSSLPFQLGGGTTFPNDSERPSVLKDRGYGSWLVAWQHWTGFQPAWWDAVALRVSKTGVVGVGALRTDRIGHGYHLMAPVVDGWAGQYTLAFNTLPVGATPPTAPDGSELRAQRFRWDESSTVPISTTPSRVLGTASYPAYRATGVAHDRVTGHAAVTHVALFFTAYTTRLDVLGYDGLPRDSMHLATQDSHAACVTFDVDAHRYFVAFGGVQNGNHRLVADHFVYPTPQAPQSYGNGCSTASPLAYGTFLAGDDDQFVRLTNAPGGVQALLALSLAEASTPLDGYGMPGCHLLLATEPGVWLGTIAATTSTGGIAEVQLALPSRLPDLDLRAQWVHAAGGGGFVTTQGLRLQVR